MFPICRYLVFLFANLGRIRLLDFLEVLSVGSLGFGFFRPAVTLVLLDLLFQSSVLCGGLVQLVAELLDCVGFVVQNEILVNVRFRLFRSQYFDLVGLEKKVKI